MTAFTLRMGLGSPGHCDRLEHLTAEAVAIDATQALTTPLKFGAPVKLVSSLARIVTTGDAVTTIYGFLIRQYPSRASTDGLGTSTAPTAGECTVMRRGYMIVQLSTQSGTTTSTVKGGPVYLRTTASGGKLYGDLETVFDSGNNVAIPGAFAMGAPDSNGITEIAYNI